MLLTDMVKHLGISVSGVGYAVEMGEAIKRDKKVFDRKNKSLCFFWEGQNENWDWIP